MLICKSDPCLSVFALTCPLVENFASHTPSFRLIRAVLIEALDTFCQEDSMRLVSGSVVGYCLSGYLLQRHWVTVNMIWTLFRG